MKKLRQYNQIIFELFHKVKVPHEVIFVFGSVMMSRIAAEPSSGFCNLSKVK